jgi:hypothetical protein
MYMKLAFENNILLTMTVTVCSSISTYSYKYMKLEEVNAQPYKPQDINIKTTRIRGIKSLYFSVASYATKQSQV